MMVPCGNCRHNREIHREVGGCGTTIGGHSGGMMPCPCREFKPVVDKTPEKV